MFGCQGHYLFKYHVVFKDVSEPECKFVSKRVIYNGDKSITDNSVFEGAFPG